MTAGRPRPARVMPRTVAEIAARLGVAVVGLPAADADHTYVTGISLDSRAVRAGDLYVGLPGAAAHGARFVADAVELGAVALLTDAAGAESAAADALPTLVVDALPMLVVDALPMLVVDEVRPLLGPLAAWLYGEPAAHLLMLGITGTSGKTTTSFLLDGGLRRSGARTGLIGTVLSRVGDTVIPSVHTTPEAPDLQALLAVMREDDVTAVSMEVSSHALTYGRTAGIRYDTVGFTNLSQDHLDFHPTLEDYFQAKAKLFTLEYARVGVVNVDDPHGRRLVTQARAGGLPVVTCSPSGDPAADWRAERVTAEPTGSTFDLVGPDGTRERASVNLPGEFNVENALVALVMLVEAGIDVGTAVAGVADVPGVPGRMERIDAGQPYLAVVDYAHKPAAVEALLETLRPVTVGRLHVVLGCGGDRDRGKRPLMGAAAVRLADEAVFTNDNPRGEDPMVIIGAMRDGAEQARRDGAAGEFVIEPDRAAAIALAVRHAGPGDTVVIAGKGHEQGQEILGEKRPFDDREELLRAIRAAALEHTESSR